MSLLGKLFPKKQPESKMPSWEEILDYMYDKGLECFDDEIIKVIYSYDRSRRFLILRNAKEIYKTALQQVVMDRYSHPNGRCPAHWELVAGWDMRSFYTAEENALNDILNSAEYKMYFTSNE